jgi:hypothetical protein
VAAGGNRFVADLAQELKRHLRASVLGLDDLAVRRPRRSRARLPSLKQLDHLAEEIEGLAGDRRLTARQFKTYRKAVARIYCAMVRMRLELTRVQHGARQQDYLARVGRMVLDAPDDVLSKFLTGRCDRAGHNLHAIALARRRQATHLQLSAWGAAGARALWATRRARANEVQSKASPDESSSIECS